MTPHLLYPQFMCDENPAERMDACILTMCCLATARNFGCSVAECPRVWRMKSALQRKESRPSVGSVKTVRRCPVMSEFKAVQTEYKGYLFRSRLEARWAVFFDTLGIQWGV